MNCYIFCILLFTTVISFLLLFDSKNLSLDKNMCYSLPDDYYSWCIQSYNRSYYEYTSGGLGNRLKSVNEIITMALVYNYLPKSIFTTI